MIPMKVRDWMDPSLPSVKGFEGHHLVPRHYQEAVLGTTDTKRINQVANFAPTDWHTNQQISDRAPAEYWPDLVRSRAAGADWLSQQCYWHALPRDWHTLSYDEFLEERRKRIAGVTRDAFEKLGRVAQDVEHDPIDVAGEFDGETASGERTLAELFHEGYLLAGDQLDPVDPDWVVDAVVTADGTVQIDGVHEFDSLDAAARFLDVTNVTGFEFWALEQDSGLAPMDEVLAADPRTA